MGLSASHGSLRRNVPALVVVALAASGVLMASGSRALGVEDKTPQLEAKPVTYSWGTLFQGESVEHTFTIKNTGEVPVVVRKITPECGCTVAREEIKDATLAPGQSLDVTLNVNTAELKPGAVKKAADIVTDGHAGDAKLYMVGVVRELFKRVPEKPVIEVVRDPEQAKTAKLSVSLASNLPGAVEITEVQAEEGVVEAKLNEATPGKRFEIVVEPRVDLRSEQALYSDNLKLKARAEGKDLDLTIPISVQLEHRIVVLPFKSVFFKPSETKSLKTAGGPLPSKELDIRSRGGSGHSFRILDIQVEKAGLEVRQAVVEEGRRYRLTVELKRPQGKKRRIDDKIIVKTDDPLVPEIVVPVLARL